jgi:hypothetical protein
MGGTGSPGAAGAATGITGSDCAGSASAVGALKVNATKTPSAPDTTVSAVVSLSILTDAPSDYRFEPVLLGASAWLAKLLHLWLL